MLCVLGLLAGESLPSTSFASADCDEKLGQPVTKGKAQSLWQSSLRTVPSAVWRVRRNCSLACSGEWYFDW